MNVMGGEYPSTWDHAESLEAAGQELSEAEQRELDEQTPTVQER
ncbi:MULTISPECIES: hypothetical protein [Actinomadura]|uniref:Uncharacterized protein n=1 Tax=Actinomadura yumaensis TaxID=111807 RepID=A0ABW2CPV2_9ACTN|nr:hypothetical protein [Actinomadura sp. J1-007]